MRRRKRGSARHSATEQNCVYDQARNATFQKQITQGYDPRAQTLRGSMNFHVYFIVYLFERFQITCLQQGGWDGGWDILPVDFYPL